MKKEIIAIGCIVLLLIGLTGCTTITSASLVGTWHQTIGTNTLSITFYADGKTIWSVAGQKITGTWKEGADTTINGQHFKTISLTLYGQTGDVPYEFNDGKLYLYTGEGLYILTRQ